MRDPVVQGEDRSRSPRLRIVLYTQYFPPETGAPQARLYELAVRLASRGHRVTVLTGMPNYPRGRVFDGYRGVLTKVEMREGMRIVRTALIPSRSARLIPRMLNYLSFALTSAAIGTWRVGRADLLIFESPPLFLAPPAILLGRLVGARIVMNVSDIWPDVLVRMGSLRRGAGLRAMLRLERFAYERSDVVAVTNPGAVRQIRDRFPAVPVSIISNGVDTDLFRPELRDREVRRELGVGDDDILVVYCGLLGVAQGLDTVLNAAARVRSEPGIRFRIIGDGPERERLADLAARLQLTNLVMLPARPKEEITSVLASADIGLVPLVQRLPGTMPSKVYETLASGVPAIVARGCEADPLVTANDVGRVYEPGDPDELALRIRELASDPGALDRMRPRCRAVAHRFSRERIADRVERLLLAVAAGRPLPEIEW
jgi:colanic acid biosynthesis glycosyl transferase WcaI